MLELSAEVDGDGRSPAGAAGASELEMRSPLGASVHSPLGRAGRGSQDGDQLAGLIDERRERVRTVHESRSKR